MVGLYACENLRQNPPLNGKYELAGAIPTRRSGTPTQAPSMARFPTPYFIEMVKTRICSSPCQNPSPVKRGNNELAKQAPKALINSNNFCALTLIPPRAHYIPLHSPLQ